MRVLVTGGTGLLGRALVERLRERAEVCVEALGAARPHLAYVSIARHLRSRVGAGPAVDPRRAG